MDERDRKVWQVQRGRIFFSVAILSQRRTAKTTKTRQTDSRAHKGASYYTLDASRFMLYAIDFAHQASDFTLHASRFMVYAINIALQPSCMRYSTSSKNSTSSQVFHCHFLFKRLPLPLLLQASVASEIFHFLENRLLHASRLALHVVRFSLRASSSVHF